MPACAVMITGSLWGQKVARDRGAAMPFQASRSLGPVVVGGSSPQTEPAVIHTIVGDNWTITHDNRWWVSWELVEFRVGGFRITDKHGNPMSRPFPNLPARGQVLWLRDELGQPATIHVRTTGWPWRTWVWASGRSYSVDERKWQNAIVRDEPILLGVAFLSVSAGVLAWLATSCGWAIFWLFRSKARISAGRCAHCGYAIPIIVQPDCGPLGTENDRPRHCPECGAPAKLSSRQQSS